MLRFVNRVARLPAPLPAAIRLSRVSFYSSTANPPASDVDIKFQVSYTDPPTTPAKVVESCANSMHVDVKKADDGNGTIFNVHELNKISNEQLLNRISKLLNEPTTQIRDVNILTEKVDTKHKHEDVNLSVKRVWTSHDPNNAALWKLPERLRLQAAFMESLREQIEKIASHLAVSLRMAALRKQTDKLRLQAAENPDMAALWKKVDKLCRQAAENRDMAALSEQAEKLCRQAAEYPDMAALCKQVHKICRLAAEYPDMAALWKHADKHYRQAARDPDMAVFREQAEKICRQAAENPDMAALCDQVEKLCRQAAEDPDIAFFWDQAEKEQCITLLV